VTGAVRVLTDFEGASLDVQRIVGTTVVARLREEALCHADGAVYDYNRHFAFGLQNLSATAVETQVLIGCSSPEELPSTAALLFASSSPDRAFDAADVWSRSDARKAYAIRVSLKAGETRYFANYLFRPYRALATLFERLGGASGARREILGHSVQGRELVAYVYARSSSEIAPRPTMLITSGVHPPEPDTFATEAIMEHLATPKGTQSGRHSTFTSCP
jgi:hypothetical protein